MADSGSRLPVVISTGFGAALLCSSCLWVDPECLPLRTNPEAWSLKPGLVRLDLSVRRIGRVSLLLDGFGKWRYSEDAVVVCRDVGPEKFQTLAGFWTDPAFDASAPLCGPGYAYLPPGQEIRGLKGECADAWDGVARLTYTRSPYVGMTFYSEEAGEPARLLWDPESPLPEALEDAAAGMFGLLCEESRKLSRVLRRRQPELAAWAGCVEDDG